MGIGSIALTWAGLLFIVRYWKGKPSMSFSKHAGQTEPAQYFYLFLFALTLPLFYVFISDWFVPELGLSGAFRNVIQVGIGLQLIAAVIPANGGLAERVHDFAAYLMSATMLVISVMLALANLSLTSRIVAVFATAYMVIGWSLLLLRGGYWRPRFHYLQTIYIVVFHAAIITAAIVR